MGVTGGGRDERQRLGLEGLQEDAEVWRWTEKEWWGDMAAWGNNSRMDLDKRRMQLYILLGPEATNALPEYHHPNPAQFRVNFDYDRLHFLHCIRKHVVNLIRTKGTEETAAETSLPPRVVRSMDPENKHRKSLWHFTEPKARKRPRSESPEEDCKP